MKKLFVLLMALLPAMACADGDKPIGFEQLPAAAREFVKKHFPGVEVTLTTVDKDWSPSYDVRMADGTHIEFDSKGEWKDVDCEGSRVPDGIVPATIVYFIEKNHADAHVTEIDRDRRGYDVHLSNRLELHFNRTGTEFRGYDD